MSSPRLNSVAKKAQRALVAARERAFEQTLGRTVDCPECGSGFVLTVAAYRGVAVRDRVQIEAVRYACPQCGEDIAVAVEGPEAS